MFVAGSTSLTLDLYGFDNDNDQTHQQVHNNGNRSSCYNEDVSYYYTKRPYFLTAPYTFPTIGPKETSSSSQTTQSIPAKERFNTSTKTFVIKTQ